MVAAEELDVGVADACQANANQRFVAPRGWPRFLSDAECAAIDLGN
jgi:hypothetical protein